MKKMRRLIPAIAMLLVSAVMLSTASFAWFTMSDVVTAEGMQIQAQGSGSLLIGDAPLTANSGKPSLTIDAGIKSLLPMAYNYNDTWTIGTNKTVENLNLGGQNSKGWYVPADPNAVDIMTGKYNDDDYTQIEDDDLALTNTNTAIVTSNNYLYKEEFYLAVAGEAKSDASVQIVLSALAAPADGTDTYKAYAAAIYVIAKDAADADNGWADNGHVPADKIASPDAIVYVDTADGRNTVTLTGLDIPSVDGVATGSEVGLKVIVHFYVDGALYETQETETVETGRFNYTAQSATAAPVDGKSYYKATVIGTGVEANTAEGGNYDALMAKLDDLYTMDANGNYTAATKIENGVTYYEVTFEQTPINDQITTTAGLYVRTAQTAEAEYNFVRTAKVSTVSTALKLSFAFPTAP